MRLFLLAVVLATPLLAEPVKAPGTSTEAAPACSSCDARKAGLKKLKAARDAKTQTAEPSDG